MADELKCKGCDATEGIFRDGYCLNCLAAELEELAGRVERLEAALREIEVILPIRIALMPASTALDMQHIARRALAGDDK